MQFDETDWEKIFSRLDERYEMTGRCELPELNSVAEMTRHKLDRIKAKDFCSSAEGALLLGCSDQHLRNLVQRVRDGVTENPIPFCDLDGPTTFPVAELLEWARLIKPRVRKASCARKNKAQLQAVA